jgi:hypothetical protein
MSAPLTFLPPDPTAARSSVGVAGLPTIVAIGPINKPACAERLAAAFTAVRCRFTTQLALLGTGAQRATVMRRAFAQGLGTSVHLVRHTSSVRWSDVVAAADIVVPSPTTNPMTVLDVLALGRPLFAPANPTTVRMIVASSVGRVYRPDAASGMADALPRLLTTPTLRHGMGCRATEVARRYELHRILRQSEKRNAHE